MIVDCLTWLGRERQNVTSGPLGFMAQSASLHKEPGDNRSRDPQAQSSYLPAQSETKWTQVNSNPVEMMAQANQNWQQWLSAYVESSDFETPHKSNTKDVFIFSTS